MTIKTDDNRYSPSILYIGKSKFSRFDKELKGYLVRLIITGLVVLVTVHTFIKYQYGTLIFSLGFV
jgi:hypothetical protein